MARKNLINVASGESDEQVRGEPNRSDRPIAGLVPANRAAAPVGGITKALGAITEKMEHAQDIERQLVEGETVVELDPELIDDSFVRDRLKASPKDNEEFDALIKAHGQQTPILVRPHPENKSRYQVAFGHRRRSAALRLNRKVKAVVKELTDEELVVVQGQENSARTDLSYIERALFAFRLEEQGFNRHVICSALSVDRAAVSKMIKLIKSLPYELIVAIGTTPQTGRRKWMELAELLGNAELGALLELLSADNNQERSSDERFDLVFQTIRKVQKPAKQNAKAVLMDQLPVSFKSTGSGTAFTVDGKKAPGFDEFIKARLADLYSEYMRGREET